jgi:AcrR family transcriptional regulator
MPPKPDQNLEAQILKAAQSLWRSHGEAGLTLREVARKAGTTTPTVYKRFRNKEELRAALAQRVLNQLNADLFSSPSVEAAYRRYLHFAETNPHEYELLRLRWMDVFRQDAPRPGRAWVLAQLASRFGGKPEDYALFFDALFLLVHGTCTLLAWAHDPASAAEARESCLAACDLLMQNIKIFVPTAGS